MINKDKKIIILNGTIITPFQLLNDKVIYIKKGKIITIENKKDMAAPVDAEVIDAQDKFVAPGFIDMHVHGGGGSDVMDGEYEAIKQVAATHSCFGTTAFLPTTMTMSKNKIIKSLKSIQKAFIKGTGAAEILGYIWKALILIQKKKELKEKKKLEELPLQSFWNLIKLPVT